MNQQARIVAQQLATCTPSSKHRPCSHTGYANLTLFAGSGFNASSDTGNKRSDRPEESLTKEGLIKAS